MDKKAVKEQVKAQVEAQRSAIIQIGEAIYKEPETGFREFKTAKKVSEALKKIGLKVDELQGIPGVVATLDTGKKGPHIAVLGEMDAVINTSHPDADQLTGAVHACGHHVQLAVMLGTAMSIYSDKVLEHLCGKITFMAVPAEEFIEVDFRNDLRKKGVVKYLGGKAECLYRGLFDNIDMCLMMHVSTKSTHKVYFPKGTNGFITKKIQYIGRASHAGAAPEEGVNALYAANVGLTAINALRETFKEEDCIRFHPIITKGGDVVNVTPATVHIEAQLRGKSIEAVEKVNQKINRALIGGAIAMGAKVEVEDLPGYMPFLPDKALSDVCKKILKDLIGEKQYTDEPHGTYSLDIGDLSSLMPTLHPFIKGAKDVMHGSGYQITDQESAYILSVKMLALTVIELLWKKGEMAKKIVKSYKPIFKSKEEYFEFVDRQFTKKSFSIDVLFDEEKGYEI